MIGIYVFALHFTQNMQISHLILQQSLLETEGQEDQVCENQSPISNITRRTISNHPTLTPKHSERTFFPEISAMRAHERGSRGRFGGIGTIDSSFTFFHFKNKS